MLPHSVGHIDTFLVILQEWDELGSALHVLGFQVDHLILPQILVAHVRWTDHYPPSHALHRSELHLLHRTMTTNCSGERIIAYSQDIDNKVNSKDEKKFTLYSFPSYLSYVSFPFSPSYPPSLSMAPSPADENLVNLTKYY